MKIVVFLLRKFNKSIIQLYINQTDYLIIKKGENMKFNKKILNKGNVVICRTKKQAEALLKWAHERGFQWMDGEPFADSDGVNTSWDKFNKKDVGVIVYHISAGQYVMSDRSLDLVYFEFDEVCEIDPKVYSLKDTQPVLEQMSEKDIKKSIKLGLPFYIDIRFFASDEIGSVEVKHRECGLECTVEFTGLKPEDADQYKVFNCKPKAKSLANLIDIKIYSMYC
jgi:hypothetical protein